MKMFKMKSYSILSMGALILTLGIGLVSSTSWAAEEPFTIGLSNGFISSEWRSQMIDDVKDVFQEYKEQGLVDELIIQSSNVGVNGQIRQVQNMIAARVDAIIINPNSPTALNPVFKEATRRGIQIIAIDQAVTSQDALNVVIDQGEWAKTSARWLVEELDGEGQIVVINGVAGHPANEARWSGAQAVFEQHPGIEILTVANGDWGQATGQKVMSNLLATYPDIDGVWVQDGMAEGALRAILAAGGDIPVMVGEARIGYMRLWNELKAEQGFSSIGVVNPPGIAASGLRVAMNLLQGRELKEGVLENGNTLYVPIPHVVTNENFDEFWDEYEDEANSFSIDGYLTEEEARSFFK